MRANDDDDHQWFTLHKDLGQNLKTSTLRKSGHTVKTYSARSVSERSLCRDFTHLRRAGHFSDAVIRVENVVFPVHRNILACCSPYFRALFTVLEGQGRATGGHEEMKGVQEQSPVVGPSFSTNYQPVCQPEVEEIDFNLNQTDLTWLVSSVVWIKSIK
ncbi:Kelch-like protein 26 [Bulinus truncatus]|nr:Kelch-like protein 26 [Bulinus truncatus]